MLTPEVARQIHSVSGEFTTPEPVQDALLAVAAALEGGPDQAYGTPLRVRWWRDKDVVDVRIATTERHGQLLWRVTASIADAAQTDSDEHLAMDYQFSDDGYWDPPHLWNLRLSERWITGLLPQAGWWDHFVDGFGAIWAHFPAELAALPPAWFDQPIVHRVDFAGDLTIRSERSGLTVAIPDVEMKHITPGTYRFDPVAALRAGNLTARTIASMFSPTFPLQDIALVTIPNAKTLQDLFPRSLSNATSKSYESKTAELAALANR
ncbi:MAG: hypothetical protein Q4F67_00305 [Propionibacteriaceae bacterium]|nr:hypothetical protein [Propionibacteriaceae bacterium]